MIKTIEILEQYKSRMFVNRFNFKRINILCGGNGSGKSTLLKLVKDFKSCNSRFSNDLNYKVHMFKNSKARNS